MGFLKKMKAKLEDLNRFLKENKSKIGGRMESMIITTLNNKQALDIWSDSMPEHVGPRHTYTVTKTDGFQKHWSQHTLILMKNPPVGPLKDGTSWHLPHGCQNLTDFV